jgi:predicted O-methyltransferase YrrM
MEINKMLSTDNWFNYSDFYDWISTKYFKNLVEVGVWKGHSISYLANKLRHNECNIYAVDLFEKTYRYENNPEHFHLQAQIPYIKKIYDINLEITNTRNLINDIQGLSWECANKFEDSSLDFVFIDADHTYESVVKDINSWYPKLKKGGILSGHDYPSWNGVKKAVDEFINKNNMKLKTFKGNVWFIEI